MPRRRWPSERLARRRRSMAARKARAVARGSTRNNASSWLGKGTRLLEVAPAQLRQRWRGDQRRRVIDPGHAPTVPQLGRAAQVSRPGPGLCPAWAPVAACALRRLHDINRCRGCAQSPVNARSGSVPLSTMAKRVVGPALLRVLEGRSHGKRDDRDPRHGHDQGRSEGHFRLVAGHGVRVVRLLSVRQPGGGTSRSTSSAGSTRPPRSSLPCWPSPRVSPCARSARSFFGRLGDLVGRKHTFLITIVIMGAVHLRRRPAARLRHAGRIVSPVILILLRLLQGLALGGEYGGAATYVAEHAPAWQARGLHRVDPDHRHPRPVSVAAGDPGCRKVTDGREAFEPGAGGSRFWSRWCCWACRSGSGCMLQESPGLPEDEGRGQGARSHR